MDRPIEKTLQTEENFYKGFNIAEATSFIQRNADRDLSSLELSYWQSMIDIILDRAEAAQERTGKKITNRQGYIQKSIASDLDALLSQALAAVAEKTAQEALSTPLEPRNYCNTHYRYYTGETCRQCLLDASIEETLKAQEPEESPAIDGATYRASIRARREQATSHP